MLIDNNVRIDKWLWAVRIFKTRNLAAAACRKGKVIIDDQVVKPSRVLKVEDIVQVKKAPVLYSYRVKGLLGKRLSARLVQEYCENITSESELGKLKARDSFYMVRDRGMGRPTKKERRTLDKISGNLNSSE
jgi:ribosome-associated heat shock protein Hsp15